LTYASGYISLPAGTPVGGHCRVVLNSDGTYVFSWSVTNTSWLGNPYNYSIVMAILGENGAVLPFAHSGSVTATPSQSSFTGKISGLDKAWSSFALGASASSQLSRRSGQWQSTSSALQSRAHRQQYAQDAVDLVRAGLGRTVDVLLTPSSTASSTDL
jgi:hypothetical protein